VRVRTARARPSQHSGRAALARDARPLNRDIKYREEFRPFAPVVPIEAADRYFELPPHGVRLARFMSGVCPVRHEWRSQLAAVMGKASRAALKPGGTGRAATEGRARCRMIEVPAPLPGRPFYININGGRLYVSAHDTYCLERERACEDAAGQTRDRRSDDCGNPELAASPQLSSP
jgi:hypothetical protein